MECFREDDDPYRRFLVTGGSPHQQGDQEESKQGKLPTSLYDVVTDGIEKERKIKLESGELWRGTIVAA